LDVWDLSVPIEKPKDLKVTTTYIYPPGLGANVRGLESVTTPNRYFLSLKNSDILGDLN